MFSRAHLDALIHHPLDDVHLLHLRLAQGRHDLADLALGAGLLGQRVPMEGGGAIPQIKQL